MIWNYLQRYHYQSKNYVVKNCSTPRIAGETWQQATTKKL